MLWKQLIFQIIFIAIIFIVVYSLLKKYVLPKFHPNKFLILALAVVSFFIPMIAQGIFNRNMSNSVLQYVSSALFVIFFLWFIDLKNGVMYSRKNDKKDIKIRPKAKPNRVHKKKK